MKHMIEKIFACLGLSLFLVGCSELAGGTIGGNFYDQQCKITITADAEDEYGLKHSITGARTLLPNPEDLEGDLTFKISGESVNGYNDLEIPQDITFTEKKATLNIRYDYWKLTLTAYKDGKRVLSGTTEKEIGRDATEVSFTLTSKGITETKGNISIAGSYVDSSGIADHAKATLKKYHSNAVVLEKDITPVVADKTFSVDFDDLDPDAYYLTIRFYDEKDNELGNWSDLVYVDPGNTTSKNNVSVVLETVPNKPNSLKAYLVDSSKAKDNYNVKVVWGDDSTNEDYFVLKINEYKDDGTVDEANPYYLFDYDTKAAATKSVVKEFDVDILVEGSRIAGHNECVISLPTGRLFEIEVAAANKFGMSDYYTDRADTTSETVAGCSGYDGSDTAHINLLYIEHLLNGGTLTKDVSTETTLDQIDYKVYKGAEFNVMEIKTTEGEFPRLVSVSNQEFKGWYKSVVDAQNDTDGSKRITKNTAFHNLSVLAGYDPTCVISYVIKTYTDLDDSRVSVLQSKTETFGTETAKNKVLAYTTTDTKYYVCIDITDPTAEDPYEYTTYSVIADGKAPLATGMPVGNKLIFEAITTLGRGTHVLNVIAVRKNDGKSYSNTFAITVNK